MNIKAVFPILVAILLVVSIVHKVRRGVDHFSGDERTPSSSAPASSSPVQPASTASAAPTSVPAAAVSASMSKVIQTTDAALQRIRNDPTLSLLERRQRETELASLRSQMIQSEAAISRLRKSQAQQAAAAAASTPATAPAPALPAPVAPVTTP